MKIKKISLFILSFLILIGIGYFIYQSQTTGPIRKVVVSPKWVNQAQFAGMFVANEQGIYKKAGLDIEFKEFNFDDDPVSNLLNEKTDFALIGAEELLVFIDEGKPIKAVAAIYQISPYVIVSLKDSGIKTPADFANKTLGNKGGKLEEELFYDLLLSNVGLSREGAVINELGFSKREIDNLLDGDSDTVDLYRTDQLYHFIQDGVEVNVIYPENYGINTYNDILVTRNDLIESDPELVRSFVESTVEGWERALKNPESAIDDTLVYVTDDRYKDRDYEKFIFDESVSLIKPNPNVSIGSMNLTNWNKLYENMLQKGFIKNKININDIFTTEFIPKK